jgi:hypothetical protein
MKYIITKTDPLRPYFGGNQDQTDDNFYCRDLYTLFDLSCVAIAEPLFDTIYPLIPAGYEEVSEDEALYGSQFFSEVRDIVKLKGPAEHDETLDSSGSLLTTGSFTLYTIPDSVKTHVINFMFKFAKEIIENEYNYRFKHNIRKTTELEQASWEIQKHEANEWLTYGQDSDHLTPFLDYIATERSINKTTLANKILTKAESYQDNLSTELVKYQKLLKEFEGCTTIRQMNTKYEKYFGIMVPALQAQEENLQDSDGRRIFDSDGTTYWDMNNPRFGNKLNF